MGDQSALIEKEGHATGAGRKAWANEYLDQSDSTPWSEGCDPGVHALLSAWPSHLGISLASRRR